MDPIPATPHTRPQPGDGAYLAAQQSSQHRQSAHHPSFLHPHPRFQSHPHRAPQLNQQGQGSGRVDWNDRMAQRNSVAGHGGEDAGTRSVAGSSHQHVHEYQDGVIKGKKPGRNQDARPRMQNDGRSQEEGSLPGPIHRQHRADAAFRGDAAQGLDPSLAASQPTPNIQDGRSRQRSQHGSRRGAQRGESSSHNTSSTHQLDPPIQLNPSAPDFSMNGKHRNTLATHSLASPQTNTNGPKIVQPASNPKIDITKDDSTIHNASSSNSNGNSNSQSQSHSTSASTEGKKKKNRKKGKKDQGQDSNPSGNAEASSAARANNTPMVRSNRRAAFEQQTKLTTSERAAAAGGEDAKEKNGQKGKVQDTKTVARVLLSAAEFAERDKQQAGQQQQPQQQKGGRQKVEEKDDLVSRLTRGLGRKPFMECPICFNSITPAQPTWSCLPPTQPPAPVQPTFNGITGALNAINEEAELKNHYSACYTPFHLSCIRDWADRSLADATDKLRGEDDKERRAEWRCPGCQKRRAERVGGYRCFCGRLPSPPTHAPAPHSCAEPCARPRPDPKCSHPCPLACHPGPCPPCQVALIVPCPSHGSSLAVKCGTTANAAGQGASGGVNKRGVGVCDEVCGRWRGCGNGSHTCQLLCHPGECAPCTETEIVQCYCGAHTQEVTCGWNKEQEKECSGVPEDGIETHWKGRYSCGNICGLKYDCGVHTCQEKCHPHPLSLFPCPTSPSFIHFCACGQTPISSLPSNIAQRTKCTDPIPTCGAPCPRSRPCGHACPKKCHTGDCPPCHAEVVRPCRCGESLLVVGCEELAERQARGEGEGVCERVCKALRKVCCPLAYKAKNRKKKNPNDLSASLVREGEDDAHECPLTCGKLLSCGLHTCARKDHKGACGRCLQASYDELICHCGETVIYPPVACGTSINCTFPCARPGPPCGHPKTVHSCHETAVCPPCPYLTEKPCACGKDQAVKNVRCSATSVSCGKTCGALLDCGYHRCDKNCHRRTPGTDGTVHITPDGQEVIGTGPDDECGKCTNTCNKPKRACGHACTAQCHAPAKCPESEPCQAIVDQRCACGNLTQRTTCGATAGSSGSGQSREGILLKCNSECMVKQRNARLADALGIGAKVGGGSGGSSRIGSPSASSVSLAGVGAVGSASRMGEVDWTDDLREFARANVGWVKVVEGTLGGFVKDGKQSMVLPHIYRINTELVDEEPHRSVLIRRRIDTRIPAPLLTSIAAPASSIGSKLTNMRAPAPVTTAASAVWDASKVGSATNGTGSGAWGRSSRPAGSGSFAGGMSSGLSLPNSGSATPRTASRPPSPLPPTLAPIGAATVTSDGLQRSVGSLGTATDAASAVATAHGQRVIGEVGRVEDDDWDVDVN